MFCVKCGKESKINYLCEKCYLEDKELIILEDFSVDLCPKCDSYNTQKYSGDKIENIINEKYDLDAQITTALKGGKIHATIVTDIPVPELDTYAKIREKNKNNSKDQDMCSNCSMKSGNYHEAIIQVRGENQVSLMKKILNFIKDKDIAKIVKKKEGYNLNVVRKSKATSIVNVVKNLCSIKSSFKLVGEKNGKKLYRGTYSLR